MVNGNYRVIRKIEQNRQNRIEHSLHNSVYRWTEGVEAIEAVPIRQLTNVNINKQPKWQTFKEWLVLHRNSSNMRKRQQKSPTRPLRAKGIETKFSRSEVMQNDEQISGQPRNEGRRNTFGRLSRVKQKTGILAQSVAGARVCRARPSWELISSCYTLSYSR